MKQKIHHSLAGYLCAVTTLLLVCASCGQDRSGEYYALIRPKQWIYDVMQEYYRTHTQPLYDLEYDIQLKAAVDLLNNENVNSLTASTKTVQELQEKEPESK